MQGWDHSAAAWIADQGETGDWTRRWVTDAVMDRLCASLAGQRVLDLGSGEGRYSRRLQQMGACVVGLEPTLALVEEAHRRGGDYLRGVSERMPFVSGRFDAVVAYLVLIDIADLDGAITEIARVLRPGGRLIIANLNPFLTSQNPPWVRDEEGRKLFVKVDNYLEEVPQPVEWRGIRIINWHRPMGRYFTALLNAGFQLKVYEEPRANPDAPGARDYDRAPYCHVMEWSKA